MIARGEYFSEVYAEFNMLQCINGFIGNKSKSYPHRDSIFVCKNRGVSCLCLNNYTAFIDIAWLQAI